MADDNTPAAKSKAATNDTGGEAVANVIANAEQMTEARAEGLKAGAEAERTRIFAILNADEAQGRFAQAKVMAEQGMTAEAAIAVLATLPRQEPSATARDGGSAGTAGASVSAFEAHMARLGNPDVDPDAEVPNEDIAAASSWAQSIRRVHHIQ